MTTFAQLDESNVVTNIVAADADWIALQDGVWVEYTEENPAYIGGTHDSTNGFIPPKPDGDWIWDQSTMNWIPA